MTYVITLVDTDSGEITFFQRIGKGSVISVSLMSLATKFNNRPNAALQRLICKIQKITICHNIVPFVISLPELPRVGSRLVHPTFGLLFRAWIRETNEALLRSMMEMEDSILPHEPDTSGWGEIDYDRVFNRDDVS